MTTEKPIQISPSKKEKLVFYEDKCSKMEITLTYQGKTEIIFINNKESISSIKENIYNIFYPIQGKFQLIYKGKDISPFEDIPLYKYFKNLMKISIQIEPLLSQKEINNNMYKNFNYSVNQSLQDISLLDKNELSNAQQNQIGANVQKIQNRLICNECNEKIIKSFCRNCGLFLCINCAEKYSSPHHNHLLIQVNISQIEKSAKNYKNLVLKEFFDINKKFDEYIYKKNKKSLEKKQEEINKEEYKQTENTNEDNQEKNHISINNLETNSENLNIKSNTKEENKTDNNNLVTEQIIKEENNENKEGEKEENLDEKKEEKNEELKEENKDDLKEEKTEEKKEEEKKEEEKKEEEKKEEEKKEEIKYEIKDERGNMTEEKENKSKENNSENKKEINDNNIELNEEEKRLKSYNDWLNILNGKIEALGEKMNNIEVQNLNKDFNFNEEEDNYQLTLKKIQKINGEKNNKDLETLFNEMHDLDDNIKKIDSNFEQYLNNSEGTKETNKIYKHLNKSLDNIINKLIKDFDTNDKAKENYYENI